MDAYYDDTMRVAFVVAGGARGVAGDAVQAAWTIGWQKLGTLRDPDRLKPWLLAVAANEARQVARRAHRPRSSGCDPYAGVGSVESVPVHTWRFTGP